MRYLDVETFVARFESWRAKHKRVAYVPKVGKAFGRSRFGGEPDMLAGEAWPACTSCEAPMLFLLQLELASLPQRPAGEGLLQLFYCSADGGDCSTWEPFSGTQLARIVSGPLARRSLPSGVEEQPFSAIVGWDAVDDYPGTQEHDELGIRYDYNFGRKTVHIVCEEIGFDEAGLDIEKHSAEALASARTGDKLFGWPHWVQGAEYPSCPRCTSRMEHLFQVDSEQGVALMFGDCGVGHITQCLKHPDVVAFGWACS